MAKTDPFGDTVNVTPDSIRDFCKALRSIAERHEAIAEWMEKDGVPGVRAKNLKSAVTALAQLGKFVGAVTTSYCDTLSASGIAELEGGIALLNRYLKRTARELGGDQAEIEAVAEGAIDVARQGLDGANLPAVKQIPSGKQKRNRDTRRDKPSRKSQ